MMGKIDFNATKTYFLPVQRSRMENVFKQTQTRLSSKKLLQNMVKDFPHHQSTFNKRVEIDSSTSDTSFESDKVLINHILTNLIKNAIEAIKENEMVTIGSKREMGSVIFGIENHIVLSDEIKSKMFNRSFSTKGAGRGIGKYSVKRFTEK